MREVLARYSGQSVDSAVAASYLDNGDFWNGSNRKFTIDSSWLPKVELAIEWYDRVIEEFPASSTSEVAYVRKLFALLGWEAVGAYGSEYGAAAEPRKYLPLVESTFVEFEKMHPTSAYLQGFRFQIAQMYWSMRNWEKSTHWLERIIAEAGPDESFYAATARARLAKLTY